MDSTSLSPTDNAAVQSVVTQLADSSALPAITSTLATIGNSVTAQTLLLQQLTKGLAAPVPAPAAGEQMQLPDAPSSRGPGLMMKGTMCKGSDMAEGCGHKAYMTKGHPNFNKKRMVAEELTKGMSCPRCGGRMEPIMGRDEDEMSDEANLEKGLVAGAHVDALFERMHNILNSLEGVPAQIEALNSRTSVLTEGLSEMRETMAKGLPVFTAATPEQPEQTNLFAPAATHSPIQTVVQGALENERNGSQPLVKGTSGNGLSDAELQAGLDRKIVRHSDVRDYKSNRGLGRFGYQIEAFRAELNQTR